MARDAFGRDRALLESLPPAQLEEVEAYLTWNEGGTARYWRFLYPIQELNYQCSIRYEQFGTQTNGQGMYWLGNDPETITLPNLLLNTYWDRKSIKPILDGITALKNAAADRRSPPVLSFVAGNFRFTPCVLSGDLTYTVTQMLGDEPVSALLNLTLAKVDPDQIIAPNAPPIVEGIPNIDRPLIIPPAPPSQGGGGLIPGVDPEPGAGLPGRDLTEAELKKYIEPGVIQVVRGGLPIATGFIVDPGGVIISNWHVYYPPPTEEADEFKMRDGTTGTITWLHDDRSQDTAIGQLTSSKTTYPVVFCAKTPEEAIKAGDTFYVIGQSKARDGQPWDFQSGQVKALLGAKDLDFPEIGDQPAYRVPKGNMIDTLGDAGDSGDSGSPACNRKGMAFGLFFASSNNTTKSEEIGAVIRIDRVRSFYLQKMGKPIPDPVIGLVGGTPAPTDPPYPTVPGFATDVAKYVFYTEGATSFAIANDGEDGIIGTAAHMLINNRVTVTIDGKKYSGTAIDSSPASQKDVAIVRIKGYKFDKVLQLGDSSTASPGTEVYSVGYPGGDPAQEVTYGTVRSNPLKAGESEHHQEPTDPYILYSSRLMFSGNSGGPQLKKSDNTVISITHGGAPPANAPQGGTKDTLKFQGGITDNKPTGSKIENLKELMEKHGIKNAP